MLRAEVNPQAPVLKTVPTGTHAVRKCSDTMGVDVLPAVPVRTPEPGEVIVDVAYAGVCGTDLHVDDWVPAYHFMRPFLPVTLGHEFSGTVSVLGDGVPQALLGQRVVVRPSVTCGTCQPCTEGQFDACRNRKGVGLTVDGGFAPQVVVPARNCIAVPEGLRSDVAALAEPFSIAWRAIQRAEAVAGPLAGRRVLVLGPGIIGQAIAILARECNALVHVVGKDDQRRCDLLREIGFDQLADIADAAGQATFEAWSPFSVAFEATGSPESIAASMPKLQAGGTFIVTGIHPRPLSLELTGLVRSEISLLGSFRPPEAVWREVLGVLLLMQSDVLKLITHRMPLSQAQHGFDLARQRLAGKVLLSPRA